MYSAVDRGVEAGKLLSKRGSIQVSTTAYPLQPHAKSVAVSH